jgi:hypothetical protein
MPAELSKINKQSVSAYCPDCHTVTGFEPQQVSEAVSLGPYQHKGQSYKRLSNVYSRCSRCGRGGLAIILANEGPASAVLESFYPMSVDEATLPSAVPQGILAEFREAEKCASLGVNRAASALFRSVLEKVLKTNGYTDSSLGNLQKRIDAATDDGVITEARRKQAHDNVRSLGNDVLHDEWRIITDEEVQDAYRYSQRILEDFYDYRATVEAQLIAKNRLPGPSQPSTTVP